jgi:preprotein translocase subunit SecD
VETGYSRAFWTIFDAQITTFIAGVVLLQYGTGPNKGFAVTLLIGIITSMFTGIFVSRIFFDLIVERKQAVKVLSI